jgi:SSS family solute:Na+ symporter
MATINTTVFLVHTKGVILFGAFFFKIRKTHVVFIFGNNNIPRSLITPSIYTTYFSNIGYSILPGIAYQSNWNVLGLSCSIAIPVRSFLKFFVLINWKVNSPTAYTYLEIRFVPGLKCMSQFVICLPSSRGLGISIPAFPDPA